MMLVTLAMMDGRRREHLAKHFFLKLSVDSCDTPTTVVPHWRSVWAVRVIILDALVPSMVLRGE
jgi:hypothetical protein